MGLIRQGSQALDIIGYRWKSQRYYCGVAISPKRIYSILLGGLAGHYALETRISIMVDIENTIVF